MKIKLHRHLHNTNNIIINNHLKIEQGTKGKAFVCEAKHHRLKEGARLAIRVDVRT